MLVLSRRQGESIVVCNDILVTVVDIRGDTVQIGIEAPPDVVVHRSEIQGALRRTFSAEPHGNDSQGQSPQ
jgi:carbon storage regulator